MSDYDTVVCIREGSICMGPVDACNDDACGLQSQINPLVVGGTTYTIVVDGFGGSAGNDTLTASPSGAFIDEAY